MKSENASVSSDLTARLEERLLHFTMWLSKRKGIGLFSLERNELQSNKAIESLIVEYVEGKK